MWTPWKLGKERDSINVKRAYLGHSKVSLISREKSYYFLISDCKGKSTLQGRIS